MYFLFLDHKCKLHNENKIDKKPNITKVLQPDTLEVSSTSEEELSEVSEEEEVEEEEEEEEEESEKEDGQDSSDSGQEYINEEEEEEEEEIQQELIDNKKESIQHNDNVDLRTELKRRRALRLNMVIFIFL